MAQRYCASFLEGSGCASHSRSGQVIIVRDGGCGEKTGGTAGQYTAGAKYRKSKGGAQNVGFDVQPATRQNAPAEGCYPCENI